MIIFSDKKILGNGIDYLKFFNLNNSTLNANSGFFMGIDEQPFHLP